jgi:shikimate kinase
LRLPAGGFEWNDPAETLDAGVDNPFKKLPEEDVLKVDPARLLGPRLNGSNLYFIGMMGTGKSTIGDKLARRK